MAFIASAPTAKCGLNFSGSQRDKVASFSTSSTPSKFGAARSGEAMRTSSAGDKEVAKHTAGVLAKEVQKLAVTDPVLQKEGDMVMRGSDGEGSGDLEARVSGLNSYYGSSDGSLLSLGDGGQKGDKPLNIKEKLQFARGRGGSSPQRRVGAKSPSSAKVVGHGKRARKGASAEAIAASLREHRGSGLVMEDQMATTATTDEGLGAHAGVENMVTDSLVGTHGESHQAK
ncbi:unnamed protein product [Urochloa humidicola]